MARYPEFVEAFLASMRTRWEDRARLDYRYFTETVNSEDPAAWDAQADLEAGLYLTGLDPARIATATLLEIGCGPARLLKRLAPNFGRALGVDIAPSMLHQAAEEVKLLTNVGLARSDGVGVPFVRDASCDVVVMHAVAIHMPLDLIRVYLADVRRVLHPTGRFRGTVNRIVDVDVEAQADPSEYMRRVPTGGEGLVYGPDYGGHSFSRDEIDDMLSAFDFEGWTVERVGLTTWAIDAWCHP